MSENMKFKLHRVEQDLTRGSLWYYLNNLYEYTAVLS